ncbi:MAG: hypothetical protein LQ351_005933 [Letrouitia transgressa]|nr:MAG: hypothetical protein LQ351_005933 [Letrouitia transgressa]
MRLIQSLLVAATAVVGAIAQSGVIAFTATPSAVTAGTPTTLRWGGGDGSVSNLQIAVTILARKSLTNGDNYALRITQGINSDNYSGLFSVSGGTGSAAATTGSVTTAAASSSPIQTAIATTNATTSPSFPPKNATTTTVPLGTGPIGTGASGAGSTGIPTTRNATLSRATLSGTSSAAASTTAAATTEGSGSSTGTAGGASASPTGGANVLDAARLASPLALIFSTIAVILYLG